MAYEDYVDVIKINSYDEIFDLIKGKSKIPDLRKDFVFRGVNDSSYDLTPSSLRVNKDNVSNISDFVDDLKFIRIFRAEELFEKGEIDEGFYNKLGGEGLTFKFYDKDLNEIERKGYFKQAQSEGEIACYLEINVLLKFLNLSDKSGLKIPFNQRLRNMIHRAEDEGLKKIFHFWPHNDYFEVISLAQHYGLPTRALDWSYDYNVALYFSVRNALKDKYNDSLLWALNYNIFEKNTYRQDRLKNFFPLKFYRPEYSINPNLNAQKGLFTFWIDNIVNSTEQPLDILLTSNLDENKTNDLREFKYNNLCFELDDDEKIMYKFVIPKELKAEILNELYLDGYSEEFLFPGYNGVTLSIKNRNKLLKILNE